jgi:hypothetical protein
MQLRPRKFKELGYGIQGPRGAGKDAFGSYVAILYMLGGVPCYSNTEIIANFQEGTVHTENLFTSQLLAMGKTYTNAEGEEIGGFKQDCLIYLSEMDKLANKFRRMSNINMVLSVLATQLRKDGVSFVGTAQDWFWVDPSWIFQTDVLVNCMDLAFTPYGKEENMPEGYESYLEMFDLSGAITGRRYKETGQPYAAFNFNTRKMWDPAVNGGQGPLYDSYKMTGLEDMLTKVVLDKREKHIGSASVEDRNIADYVPRSQALNYIQGALEAKRAEGQTSINNSEIRHILVDAGFQGDIRTIGRHIEKLGFKKVKTATGDVYEIPPAVPIG